MSDLQVYDENNQVKVPRDFISKYKWGYGVLETRLLMTIIEFVDIQKDQESLFDTLYRIKARDFIEHIGAGHKGKTNSTIVEEVFDNLYQKPLQWRKGLAWRKRPWFIDYGYDPSDDVIEFKINPEIKPDIERMKLSPSYIGLSKLLISSKFTSQYAYKLYLMCYDHRLSEKPFHKTYDELIELWDITEDSYTTHKSKRSNFNARIIGIKSEKEEKPSKTGKKKEYDTKWVYVDTAKSRQSAKAEYKEYDIKSPLKQVNMYSDIIVTVTPLKTGKSFEKLRFEVKMKGENVTEDDIMRSKSANDSQLAINGLFKNIESYEILSFSEIKSLMVSSLGMTEEQVQNQTKDAFKQICKAMGVFKNGIDWKSKTVKRRIKAPKP